MRILKSALNREHAQIRAFVRATLLTMFLLVGALSSIYLGHHHYFSDEDMELLFFGGFAAIVASLFWVSGLAKTMFRGFDDLINSGRGTGASVTIVPLDYHSRCSAPGCRRLGRILLRYAGGRPKSNREFCLAHGRSRVERDRAAGFTVYDDREVN